MSAIKGNPKNIAEMEARLTRADVLVREDIEKQLMSDARVLESDVNVIVNDGEVVLTGEVPSNRAKNAASEDAWTVPEVVTVKNNLAVRYEAAEIDVPDDMDIAANVVSSLSWDPELDATDIRVTVENGIVTIQGTVVSLWKKQIAEDTAWNHMGVIDVINKLAVASPADITDQAAAQIIVDTIDRNLNVDVNNVDVEDENGKAILNGVVKDGKAWRAVYEAAFYTNGIKKVEDNITLI